MDIELLRKFIFSIIALLVYLLGSNFLWKKAKEISKKKNLKQERYFAIKRMLSILCLIFLVFLMILIWGVNIKNLWLSIAGILAMIAVAFFAVWSLIGNILAGLIIYFTTPFKINDEIEVLPDGIKGRVVAINTFYSLLIDEEQNYINIPNSLFFQKYIKNFKKN